MWFYCIRGTHAYPYMHTYIYIYIHACIYIHTHVYIYVYSGGTKCMGNITRRSTAYSSDIAQTHTHIYAQAHVHIHRHTHTHTHTHTHMHMHTHSGHKESMGNTTRRNTAHSSALFSERSLSIYNGYEDGTYSGTYSADGDDSCVPSHVLRYIYMYTYIYVCVCTCMCMCTLFRPTQCYTPRRAHIISKFSISYIELILQQSNV